MIEPWRLSRIRPLVLCFFLKTAVDQYIGSPDGIDFRVYSIKRRGAYWLFSVSDVAFIQGRRLFQSHIIL